MEMSRSDLDCTRVQEDMDWSGSDLRFGVSQRRLGVGVERRRTGQLMEGGGGLLRKGSSDCFYCF